MSAFPDDKNHFVRWLAKHLPGSNTATFAPRKLYGDYLLNIFMKLRKYSDKADYLNSKAIEVTREDNLWLVHLENGNIIEARAVVLALGNMSLPDDPIDFRAVGANYHRNPWSEEMTKNLPANAPVLLIGTGLTMVDVALSLRETGHRGIIHALSRNGLLYRAHKPYTAQPLMNLPEQFDSPHGALRWIRTQVEVAQHPGSDWRAVIDSLRPHTASIWQSWNLRQRKSFLRHARNLWDIHRHRMSLGVADQLSILLEDRTLVIHRGSLVSANAKEDRVTVTWKDKDAREWKTLDVARVINCTGPSRDITKVQSSLISKLLASGWLSPDPLRLGIETDPQGRLLDKNGNISEGLYALGPLCIAGLWESIAIPEIREQALALAELLVSEIVESGVPA